MTADRDSSVYNELVSKQPYGSLFMVQKIDCKNHLLRNYRKWTMALFGNTRLPLPAHVDQKDKQAVAAMKKELLELRCHIRDNFRRMSCAISKASTHRGGQTGT